MDWYVILNPRAGSCAEVESIDTLLHSLGGFQKVETAGCGDAGRLARSARDKGFQRIAVAGGDGTINEVINGLAPDFQDVQLGIIPLGTGNDLARGLSLPKDPAEAVERIADASNSLEIDLMRIQMGSEIRFCANTSSGGFSAKVNEKMTGDSKSWWGPLAYYISAAKALPELASYELHVTLASGEEFETSAYSIVVANGCYIAGGIPIVPDARLNDGVLNLLVVPDMPAADILAFLSNLILEKKVDGEELIRKESTSLRIQANPTFKINADGELFGELPAIYEVLPRTLEVVGVRDGCRTK